MAQRMSLLYELNSPEFFDKTLFKNFIDLLRARNVLGRECRGTADLHRHAAGGR